MFKKWLELIFDHKISLRERMFRVVTGICMVALMFVLPMGRSLANMLILVLSLICIAFIVKISIQKKCINTGATCITVLLLLLFPLSFFPQADFIAECLNGSCFVLFTSALFCREGVRPYFLCFVRLRHCSVIILPFIFRSTLRRIRRDILFLILQILSLWWDY